MSYFDLRLTVTGQTEVPGHLWILFSDPLTGALPRFLEAGFCPAAMAPPPGAVSQRALQQGFGAPVLLWLRRHPCSVAEAASGAAAGVPLDSGGTANDFERRKRQILAANRGPFDAVAGEYGGHLGTMDAIGSGVDGADQRAFARDVVWRCCCGEFQAASVHFRSLPWETHRPPDACPMAGFFGARSAAIFRPPTKPISTRQSGRLQDFWLPLAAIGGAGHCCGNQSGCGILIPDTNSRSRTLLTSRVRFRKTRSCGERSRSQPPGVHGRSVGVGGG